MTHIQLLADFEQAAAQLWQAHRQHVQTLDAASRRALYNALKTYRRNETVLFRGQPVDEESPIPA